MRTDNQNRRNASIRKTQHIPQQASEPCPSDSLQTSREERYLTELSRLKSQIADISSEREAACRKVKQLKRSLSAAKHRLRAAEEHLESCRSPLQASSSGGRLCWSWSRTVTTATVFLLLGVLASAITLRNAQSTVQAPRQPSVHVDETLNAAADDVVEPVEKDSDAENVDKDSDKDKKPPQTKKRKTRFASARSIEHRQWGPPLLLPTNKAGRTRHLFDPLVKAQQIDLLRLGFDIGEADGFKGSRTKQALNEFHSLYLSGGGLQEALSTAELATLIKSYAKLASNDAQRFHVDRGVVAAIRLSSVRTGVDFSYLMELAAAESNFNPVSKAGASSAVGLYQFTHDTWLNTVKMHGEKYGLGDYVAQIEFYVTRSGYQRPMVQDKRVYQHLLDLRMNPRVSAMMAAETVKDSLRRLTFSFDRQPARTDLYLSHFLGYDGAISFLRALDENPDAFAVELFPAAAKSNRNIFHPKVCEPRTVNEVYELFDRKFNTSRYE